MTQRVKFKDIEEGMVLAESIYAVVGDGRMMIARKDTVVDDKIIEQIERYEISAITIQKLRKPGTGTRILEDSLQTLPEPELEIPHEKIPGKVKSAIKKDLRKEAIDAIRDLFAALQKLGEDVNLTTTYQVVRRFENVLNRLVSESSISKYIHVQDLKVIEDFPYFHSLSVAMLSVATGKALGFDLKRRRALAMCAILHDVGKPRIPKNIMAKKERLTEDEISVIHEHAVNGAINLKTKGFGDVELWNGIMFHHEKVDGTGYPKGLVGDEIPIFSKIIAVADTYDAITSVRPHRAPMPPAKALDLISSEVGKSFDFEIVKAFTKNLLLYPVGTAVELNDSRLAVVVDCENILRPVVETMDNGEKIDLAENLSYAITKVVSVMR
jgi:HD-GYP domain-containing protein (c-di-GMP phosphodiesterase class II)